MPRLLSAAMLAALAQSSIPVALFAQISFANETLYLFGGVGSLTPAGPPASPLSTFPYGQTFTGLGWLAKVSGIPQTTKLQAQNITLSLSGIPSQLVLDAVNQVRLSGTANIWLGFFDSNGALIDDPAQLFSGALDVPTLTDGGDTCTLSITCENPLVSLNLAPNRRFDDADQQLRYPGDLGMSFVDALANLQLFWPMPVNWGTPYPTSLVITPNNVDILIGHTQQMTATMHFSDGSIQIRPGSGPFNAAFATSNPKVATIDNTTGIITGVGQGTCEIMCRTLFFTSGQPGGSYRSACTVIVRTV